MHAKLHFPGTHGTACYKHVLTQIGGKLVHWPYIITLNMAENVDMAFVFMVIKKIADVKSQ